MKKIVGLILMLGAFVACDSMDDNYKDYQKSKQYSPRVNNLRKVESVRTIELFWENPQGDLAQKIQINTGDSTFVTNEMVAYYKLENLEIKGYEIAVYTIDKYGNLSVPATIFAFPGTPIDGEE